MSENDRTVHGDGQDEHGDKYDVVRYERGGKWWIEFRGGYRRQLDLDDAVDSADRAYLGLPGGQTFDARWRAAVLAAAATQPAGDEREAGK